MPVHTACLPCPFLIYYKHFILCVYDTVTLVVPVGSPRSSSRSLCINMNYIRLDHACMHAPHIKDTQTKLLARIVSPQIKKAKQIRKLDTTGTESMEYLRIYCQMYLQVAVILLKLKI